jgi:hypothetical protein
MQSVRTINSLVLTPSKELPSPKFATIKGNTAYIYRRHSFVEIVWRAIPSIMPWIAVLSLIVDNYILASNKQTNIFKSEIDY